MFYTVKITFIFLHKRLASDDDISNEDVPATTDVVKQNCSTSRYYESTLKEDARLAIFGCLQITDSPVLSSV